MEKQKYMKASDVALRFGVTRQTVSNWVERGYFQSLTIDGTRYITIDSLKKLEDSLIDIKDAEANLRQCKESFEAQKSKYINSIRELRDCQNINKALAVNKLSLVKFLSLFFNIASPKSEGYDRDKDIVKMLLSGNDVRTLAKIFNLTPSRVQQIIEMELRNISKDIESYELLKSEKDRLLTENKVLKMNAKVSDNKDYALRKVENVSFKTLNKNIQECNVSIRAKNCCLHGGIHTIADLVGHKRSELLKMRNFGLVSLNELDRLISGYGLAWGKNYIVNPDETVSEKVPLV